MRKLALLLLPLLSQFAFAYTARLELRDTLGTRAICNGVYNCSTDSVFDIGFGVTDTWDFESTSIKLYGGILFRQRSIAASSYPNYGTAKFSYLEIPVQAAIDLYQFTVRLGPNLGVLVHETHSEFGSYFKYLRKDIFVFPIELAVDWHFAELHQIGLSYETPVRMANGKHQVNNIGSGGVISLVYGYSI